MKSAASPVSLLLFIRAAASAPIPHRAGLGSSFLCPFQSCLEYPFPSPPDTPATKLRNPHFPDHQLVSEDIDTVIDNHPLTPSISLSPSTALTADQPLSSSYLLSLAGPGSAPALQKPPQAAPHRASSASPAKPTSALPGLREDDAKRYWASLPVGSVRDEAVEHVVLGDGPFVPGDGRELKCACRAAVKSQAYSARQNAGPDVRNGTDGVAVGIVLIFVAVVVCVEVIAKLGNLRSLLRRLSGHGAISLDENLKEPSCQSCPPPYQMEPKGMECYQDCDTAAKLLHHDNTVDMKAQPIHWI
ncbi:uncharacterized protein BP5553_09557 [Venustampulla echinocandica]|uniref:Uncharacterized protein n=1 Tax=Venustampulla echinocandica TaxID=2656787 RepID=A0A370TBB9_9HELO|nr:uncharacterized protein BP5553_09557 [Venustampulla echinocandica]RDL31348.1 hypothetical protein BP5553_09557 [Venustampulla echinocandica]